LRDTADPLPEDPADPVWLINKLADLHEVEGHPEI
jgi:hypothetical protein